MNVSIDHLLPLKEVRQLLSISNVTLWKWVRQGKISVVKLSPRKVYVREQELERFIHDADQETSDSSGPRRLDKFTMTTTQKKA